MNHVMKTEAFKGQGKLVFSCARCDRRVEFFGAEGRLKVVRRGDPDAVHIGGSLTVTSAEIDQQSGGTSTVH
jgi:hypothetical protein